ncbi:MAG: GLPGLI family protein [Bacteroidota bacterium]
MPKTLLLLPLFVLSLCTVKTNAQNAPVVPEGKIRYLIAHNWSKKMAALDYISQQRKERDAYMWGGSQSEWKEYGELFITPETSFYRNSEETAEGDESSYAWRRSAYAIRRNFGAASMLDQIEQLGTVYVIEDSLHCQVKILNDLKEVAGHLCMNASWTDTIKDQHIIAWFALDLPISSGPERFCGLPGLILEVEINDGALVITADKMDMRALTTEEASVPKKIKGKRIKETDYTDIVRKYVQEKKKEETPWFWGLRY